METIVSRTLSVHKEHEFLLKLETAGFDDELAQKVIGSKDNELAVKVVRFISNGGFEPTTNQKIAREIMGKNFFGVEEAIKHFGVNPSKQQLLALSEIPFAEAILKECNDTHILIAIFPLSILDVRGKVDSKLFCSHGDAWYNKQVFAKEKGEISWQLVKKTPVENSVSKTWNEQQALLSKDEEMPSARIVVYTTIGHFLVTNEWLFKNIYVRCSDLDSDGHRVYVGNFDSGRLYIDSVWDDYRDDNLGLASSRKFQN